MNQESTETPNQNNEFLEFLNSLNLFEYHEYLVTGGNLNDWKRQVDG